jgi:hypothetical protein
MTVASERGARWRDDPQKIPRTPLYVQTEWEDDTDMAADGRMFAFCCSCWRFCSFISYLAYSCGRLSVCYLVCFILCCRRDEKYHGISCCRMQADTKNNNFLSTECAVPLVVTYLTRVWARPLPFEFTCANAGATGVLLLSAYGGFGSRFESG